MCDDYDDAHDGIRYRIGPDGKPWAINERELQKTTPHAGHFFNPATGMCECGQAVRYP